MSISTHAPTMWGAHTGNGKTSKRAESSTAVRDRLGRLSGSSAGGSRPDSCFEVVDGQSGRPRSDAGGDRARGRFANLLGVAGSRLFLAGRTRVVLALSLLVVAVIAGAMAWFSWPSSPEPAGAVAVAQTQQGDAAQARRLTVSVVGDVVKPGVVEVPSGARVADAIEAAGGLEVESGSTGYLNLARKVKDGELIVVEAGDDAEPQKPGDTASPGSGQEPDPAAGDEVPGGPINLNEATETELTTLPGIGPVTAAAIIAYRDENGGFDSVDQLADVDGIGPATMEELSGKVTV